MKVLGLTKDGYDRTYIVEVSHSELKVAFEKGYREDFKELKVGDTLNLAEIPYQRERIVRATEAMQKAYEQFVVAAPVMAEVARVIGKERQSA